MSIILQELSESLSTREPDLLEELRSAADNLKSCSSPEVQNEIETTVEESVVQWNDSRKSLRNLCERYQNAIKIWAVYRKNSDIVNEWVDNQLSSLSSLPAEQAAQQLQVRLAIISKIIRMFTEIRSLRRYTKKQLMNKQKSLSSYAVWLWKSPPKLVSRRITY